MHTRSFRISGVWAYDFGLPTTDGAGHGGRRKISSWVFSHMLLRRVCLRLWVCRKSYTVETVVTGVFVMWGHGWHKVFLFGAAGVFWVTCYMVWVSIIRDLVAAYAL
jgi:hypothetical protein